MPVGMVLIGAFFFVSALGYMQAMLMEYRGVLHTDIGLMSRCIGVANALLWLLCGYSIFNRKRWGWWCCLIASAYAVVNGAWFLASDENPTAFGQAMALGGLLLENFIGFYIYQQKAYFAPTS